MFWRTLLTMAMTTAMRSFIINQASSLSKIKIGAHGVILLYICMARCEVRNRTPCLFGYSNIKMQEEEMNIYVESLTSILNTIGSTKSCIQNSSSIATSDCGIRINVTKPNGINAEIVLARDGDITMTVNSAAAHGRQFAKPFNPYSTNNKAKTGMSHAYYGSTETKLFEHDFLLL